MADTVAIPQNGVIQLAEVVAKLAPAFFGKTVTDSKSGSLAETSSSDATGTSKKSVDPRSQAQIDALMATLMPQITGTGNSNDVVANILRKATEAFAPTLGQQNQAGIHNSTVTALLRNDAIARATGESASAVLTAQQQAAQTAAGLIKTQAEGNSTITENKAATESKAQQSSGTATSKTSPTIGGVNPLSSLLMAGLTAYGGQKLKKFASPYLDQLFGSDGGGSAINSGISGDAFDAFFGGGSSPATPTINLSTEAIQSLVPTEGAMYSLSGAGPGVDAAAGLTTTVFDEPLSAGAEAIANAGGSLAGGAAGTFAPSGFSQAGFPFSEQAAMSTGTVVSEEATAAAINALSTEGAAGAGAAVAGEAAAGAGGYSSLSAAAGPAAIFAAALGMMLAGDKKEAYDPAKDEAAAAALGLSYDDYVKQYGTDLITAASKQRDDAALNAAITNFNSSSGF